MNVIAESSYLALAEHALNQGVVGDPITRRNYYQSAIDLASKAIDSDPSCTASYLQRGKAYFYRKQYDRAFVDYLNAISYKSDDMLCYLGRYALANIMSHLEVNYSDLLKAELLYHSAPRQQVNLTDAELVLKSQQIDVALTYNRQGEYQKALKICYAVLQLSPYDVLAYGCRLVAHEQLHEYEAALLDCLVLRVIDKAHDSVYQLIEADLLKQIQQRSTQPGQTTSTFFVSPRILPATLPNRGLNNLPTTPQLTPAAKPNEAKESPALNPGKSAKNKNKGLLDSPPGISKKQRYSFFTWSPESRSNDKFGNIILRKLVKNKSSRPSSNTPITYNRP